MSITTDGTATSWRDLVDQLTPTQVSSLEKCESRYAAGGIQDELRASAARVDVADGGAQ